MEQTHAIFMQILGAIAEYIPHSLFSKKTALTQTKTLIVNKTWTQVWQLYSAVALVIGFLFHKTGMSLNFHSAATNATLLVVYLIACKILLIVFAHQEASSAYFLICIFFSLYFLLSYFVQT